MLQQLAKVLLSVLVARLLDKVRIRSKMCVAFITGRAIIMAATSPSSKPHRAAAMQAISQMASAPCPGR